MNRSSTTSEQSSNPWLSKIQRHLASGRKTLALQALDHVIELDMPLFYSDPVIQEERRLAWLCRIDLLREWGRLSEALAWTCFECELNPANVAAQALKERLKAALHLNERGQPTGANNSRGTAGQGIWPGVAGMRELKAILERDVILPLQEPESTAATRSTFLTDCSYMAPLDVARLSSLASSRSS